MLIPPSIALVLYGIIADVSIGKLLIGGVIPGLLVTLTIALTVMFLVFLDPSRAPVGRRFTMREKFASLKVAGPMIGLFLAVTGSIYLGIATPTEASGLGAFGALLLAWRAGKVNWTTLRGALVDAATTSCMIFMIILGARIFGYFFTLTQITQTIVTAIAAWEVSKWVIMAIIVLIYLVLGCIMDQIAILILTVPVMLPVIKALGFDPVWFGVLVIVIAEVGLLTPPVGLNVFVVARYTKRPVTEVFAGVWPHVYAHLILITIFIIFPELILWLPNKMA
jgi:C4-dicarboxylate transporter, DctM subunit